MKTSKPLTVVFYVQDDEKFKEYSSEWFSAMCSGEEVEGAIVTAIGWEDAFSKLEELEEQLD